MDGFTKRFLRDLLMVGAPWGISYGIITQWDADWWFRLIAGLVFGSAIGLPYAFSNGLHSRKPVFLVNLGEMKRGRESLSAEPVVYKSRFRTAENIFWLNVFFILYIVVVSGMFRFLRTTLNPILLMMLGMFWVGFMAGLNIMLVRNKLILSPSGLEYHGILHRIGARWDQVARIEKRGKIWRLVCSVSEIGGNFLVKGWLRFFEDDLAIPLNGFAKDLPGSELLEGLRQFAPEIEVYSTL